MGDEAVRANAKLAEALVSRDYAQRRTGRADAADAFQQSVPAA